MTERSPVHSGGDREERNDEASKFPRRSPEAPSQEGRPTQKRPTRSGSDVGHPGSNVPGQQQQERSEGTADAERDEKTNEGTPSRKAAKRQLNVSGVPDRFTDGSRRRDDVPDDMSLRKLWEATSPGGRPIEARKRQEDVDGEMPATRARTYPASTYQQTAKNKPKPTTILEVEADQEWAKSGPARPQGRWSQVLTANNQRTDPQTGRGTDGEPGGVNDNTATPGRLPSGSQHWLPNA